MLDKALATQNCGTRRAPITSPHRKQGRVQSNQVLIPEPLLHELTAAAERLRAARQAIDQVIAAVERIDPFLPDDARLDAKVQGSTRRSPSDAGPYRITRRMTYADVVLRAVVREEFTAEEAWRTIRPLIHDPPERARESMRRSLDNDPRFDRIATPHGARYRKLAGAVPDR